MHVAIQPIKQDGYLQSRRRAARMATITVWSAFFHELRLLPAPLHKKGNASCSAFCQVCVSSLPIVVVSLHRISNKRNMR